MSTKASVSNDYKDKLKAASYMFAGLNNVLDPYNLPIEKGWLVKADNVDIDNTNSISRRDGFASVLATTTAHSGWSNGSTGYFVDDVYLKSFNGSTTSTIAVVSGNIKMHYCICNDIVVYSNGIDSGIIGGFTNTQTKTYSTYFKENSALGIHLEFYNGRLYHAKENTLYCTDVFDIEHSDIRHKQVATLKSRITMVKKVEDGIYLGSENQIHFLRGNDIQEGGFDLEILAEYGVVENTAFACSGSYMPDAKTKEELILFLSKRGICSGSISGGFANQSIGFVSIPEAKEGCAIVRDKGGFRSYITTIKGLDSEYNPYSDVQEVQPI